MNVLRKIVINTYNLLTGAKNPFVYRALFFFLFVSPVIALALINYTDLERDITKSILAKRRSLCVVSAANVIENLDNLTNLAISYTTRPRIIEYVEKRDWKDAISITKHALDLYPSFDRIIIYDREGVIKADMPHAMPSVIGQSRADREWYNSFKGSWKPYISGVYIRSAEPKIPVVSVIVPIKTKHSMTTEGHSTVRGEQKVLGILQFQVKLDIFSHWIKNIDTRPGSIIYIVDQHGHLVYHPKYVKEGTPTDFSSVGIVAKVLRGIGGIEVNYDPILKEERLAAYEPISPYGWGVVITQPAELAFIEKNEQLKYALIVHSIIVFLTGVIALIILYSIVIYKHSEEKIQQMAYLDSLTGLPGRKLFSDRLYITLALAQRNQKIVGIAMLDLDNFKVVNDTFGHNAGDLLLKATAERLSATLRKSDTVAHFGGDEFVLILPDLKGTEDAIQVAKRIIDNFRKPLLVDRQHLFVTTSIGITVYPIDGTDEGILLKNVDIAMHQAKLAGRNRYQLYKEA